MEACDCHMSIKLTLSRSKQRQTIRVCIFVPPFVCWHALLIEPEYNTILCIQMAFNGNQNFRVLRRSLTYCWLGKIVQLILEQKKMSGHFQYNDVISISFAFTVIFLLFWYQTALSAKTSKNISNRILF